MTRGFATPSPRRDNRAEHFDAFHVGLSFSHVLLALAGLTAIRIVGLRFSVVDLYMDEAQYWAWSRELAYGYFSKPPLLAWIIAAAESVCGSGEACVRVASPLFHFATCLLVYAIARQLYDQPTAVWSALVYGLGTGVIFSTRIISTDVPLMFFWALALLGYVKLLARPEWRWTITFGVACGLGILSKYAMVYFFVCALCSVCFDRGARALLKRPQIWAALAMCGLLVLPNVVWNVSNDFATLKHTGDNITGSGLRFRPVAWLGFLAAQLAVAGPLVFATFLYLLVRLGRLQISREDRLMLIFAIPPLALVTALAFFRSVNANWAAPAILSMTILVVAWWQKHAWKRWFAATLAIGLTAQVLLLVGDTFAERISIAALGKHADLYRRTLGGHALGERVAELARIENVNTVGAEGRSEVAALVYYLRNEPVRALSWPARSTPDNQFDLTRALDDSAQGPVLFVSICPIASRLQRFYEEVTPLGPFIVSTGPTSHREYHAFVLEGQRRAIEPLGRCIEVAQQ